MLVVGQGHRAGRLRRTGHHQSGMLADDPQEVDQFGVAGEEADPHPGQIGALRQRVHGHHAFEPALQDGLRWRRTR